jgi:hypothetical protein
MAKRKTSTSTSTTKSSQLNPETLERARQQAVQTAADERAERRARVRKASSTREAGKPRRIVQSSDEKLSAHVIEERLAYPTKYVSEAELRNDYSFVLRDLRNMGMLAAGLFVVLIGLAVFFIR